MTSPPLPRVHNAAEAERLMRLESIPHIYIMTSSKIVHYTSLIYTQIYFMQIVSHHISVSALRNLLARGMQT